MNSNLRQYLTGVASHYSHLASIERRRGHSNLADSYLYLANRTRGTLRFLERPSFWFAPVVNGK
jgi:hypothetical protein